VQSVQSPQLSAESKRTVDPDDNGGHSGSSSAGTEMLSLAVGGAAVAAQRTRAEEPTSPPISDHERESQSLVGTSSRRVNPFLHRTEGSNDFGEVLIDRSRALSDGDEKSKEYMGLASQFPALAHSGSSSINLKALERDRPMYVDLSRFVDQGCYVVSEVTPASRIWRMFRSLCMKQIVVVNLQHQPIGIITLRDLLL